MAIKTIYTPLFLSFCDLFDYSLLSQYFNVNLKMSHRKFKEKRQHTDLCRIYDFLSPPWNTIHNDNKIAKLEH